MKLRPSRLPSLSTLEASDTADQSDFKKDDTTKTKLGSLWRKAKREALSLSPRAKATERMQTTSTNTTGAPGVTAVHDSKKTNSTNAVPSPSTAGKVSSPRTKRKQVPKADDPSAPLKHRLPKKHGKKNIPSTNSTQPIAPAIKLSPIKTDAQPEEKQANGRPPIHSTRSKKSTPRSASSSAKNRTSASAGSIKTPNAGAKIHSENSSKSHSTSNIQHGTKQNIQQESAVSATSVAASRATSKKSESSNPSPEINSLNSSRNKLPRTRTGNNLTPLDTRHCSDQALQEERAASNTVATGTATKDAGEKKKKKKSALQQFREEEAVKAAESAKMKEDTKEIEKNQTTEQENNGRWWWFDGLGVGTASGAALTTQPEQREADPEKILLTPKDSKVEGDSENKILTPKASNATPKNKKKELFAEGELGDEGFEVTRKRNPKRKPKAKAEKISEQVTKRGADSAPKCKNVDMEPALASSDAAAKCRNEVKTQPASTGGVKPPTPLQAASATSRKPKSSQQEKASAKSSDGIKSPEASTKKKSDKQSPSKTVVKEKSPDSTPSPTKRTTQGSPNGASSQHRKKVKSTEKKSKSTSSSSKLVSQKKIGSGEKASTPSPETANIPVEASDANETPQATMSPKSKSLRRRQELGINSLTDNETDGDFPETAAYSAPRYGCFGSEAIVPDATSDECEAAFPLTVNSIDIVGSELIREASTTIRNALSFDPNQIKMNIERIVHTPQSAKRMNIDRVVVTENVDSSPQCFFGGITNWFRDRRESDGDKRQEEKANSVFGSIRDNNDEDLYPLSPINQPNGFCNAGSCYDTIRFREEYALDDDREWAVRNISSYFSNDRETIGAQSCNADTLDEVDESDCEALDDSDADFEGDFEDCLEDETEEELNEDTEEDLGLDADTTFGEGTVESCEEDGDDLETGSETEDSESEFYTFDEEESIDSETDLDSGSSRTSSTSSKSVDDSEEELSDSMGYDKESKDGSWMKSMKISSTFMPKQLHPTPLIVNSPISEDQHRSIDGTSTFESNYSSSGRKTPTKNLFSNFFRRSVSRVDKTVNLDTKVVAGSIDANDSLKSSKQPDILHANKEADVPSNVLYATPPLNSDALIKNVERHGSEVNQTPSSSSLLKTNIAEESIDSDVVTFLISANASSKGSMPVSYEESSSHLDKIEVSFSIASSEDQSPDFSQGVSIVTTQETLEMGDGHAFEQTSFELIFDHTTSVSISTSLENEEGEKSVDNQEEVEPSTSEHADMPSAPESPPEAESQISSIEEEASADPEMEESSPTDVNTDELSPHESELDASQTDVESRQDAITRAPMDSSHEDSNSEQREEEAQPKMEGIKVDTVAKDMSFDNIDINLVPSTHSKKSDPLSPASSGADVSVRSRSKVFPRRKSKKMGSFLMGRHQTKPDKRLLLVDKE